ncbi:MAG: hypothetical protein BWK76_10495 [Desulfobulbaceae bacterium A2]|nr:MAG: hypothetical protein BWK76_10495 [Desulfobulbaceae bacterium A2]
MKRYRFLTGPDDAKFCQRVTDALNEGWQLYGSPALTFDGKTVIAGQAIVREMAEESSHEPEANCHTCSPS